MNTVIRAISDDDLYQLLADELAPGIREALDRAAHGQRLRVTTLPVPVINRICKRLEAQGSYRVYMLGNSSSAAQWEVTSTKLIELRNTVVEPLLVFIPPNMRTAAEDSFDIATFTELALRDASEELRARLLERLSGDLRRRVEHALEYIRLEGISRNTDEIIDFLLTVLSNGATPASAGAALYCVGLVPDLEVFNHDDVVNRLSINWNKVKILDDANAPLLSRIGKLNLDPDTIQTKLFVFLRGKKASIRSWGRELATTTEGLALTFDKWPFSELGVLEELRLVLEDLDLPVQVPDDVGDAAQMKVFDLDDSSPLKVAFYSLPRPSEVPTWKHYRIQILSVGATGPSVAWESNSFPKPEVKRKVVRRSLRVDDLQALEEGTYYLKIDAYDANGNLLTKVRPLDPTSDNSRAENESEYFLVIKGGTEVEPPEARAVFVSSAHDAWASLATRALGAKTPEAPPEQSALRGGWQEPLRAPLRGDVHFRLEGDDGGGHTIALPSLFRKLELEILRHPDQLGLYRVKLTEARLADVTIERREAATNAEPVLAPFIEARKMLFAAILAQPKDRAGETKDLIERDGIVETVDLLALRALIEAYLDAFLFISEQAKNNTQLATAIAPVDTVELRWRSSTADPGRALLLGPTHPTRIAWHLQHAQEMTNLVSHWRDKTAAVRSFRDAVSRLRREIQPSHLPTVIFDGRGRGYVEQMLLTSHWSLYLPEGDSSGETVDVAASRDRARSLLGVRASRSYSQVVGGPELAERLLEYLELHPYVEQLHINVFNAGDGGLVADALRELEHRRRKLRRPGTEPALRYLVRLFSTKSGLDLTGLALEALLDPDRQVGEDDEFALASANPLYPKLVLARNTIDEFLAKPASFTAHVAVMLEQFAVRTRVGKVSDLRRGSYVSGLVQEPEIRAESWNGAFSWHKGLNPLPSSLGAPWEKKLVRSIAAMQEVQAQSALKKESAVGAAPLLAMMLDPQRQSLLKQVHTVSDWVLTIDRNLALEFYDSPSAAREAGYLLDFAPEYLQQDQLRLMLTTRSAHELEAIVRPALQQSGLTLPPSGEIAALEALRSLSGRLALRFLSSWTQSAEVVGLLLARWLLEHVGLLADRIVIPLDAHRAWFSANEEDQGRSQQRADLLLVSVDPSTRTVHGKIVEVKFRDELPNAARTELYRRMREQSENTEERLRDLFDLQRFPLPRADAALSAKELATALAFYVRRARRYRLLGEDQARLALDFIQDLDAGYQLELTMVGVLFERAAAGAHIDEDEPGYVVHRFGLDLAERLVKEACHRFLKSQGGSDDGTGGGFEGARPKGEASRATAEFDTFRDAIERGSPGLSRSKSSTSEAPATEAPSREAAEEATSAVPPQRIQSPVREQTDKPYPELSPQGKEVSSASDRRGDYSAQPASGSVALSPDVLVGATEPTKQFGILGTFGSAKVAIDLNGCNTMSLFGVQGFGKSYTLGVVAEMASKAVAGINVLPAPLATVVFHYHKSDAYAPEYASAIAPNRKERETQRLRDEFGAHPLGLDDVILLTPAAKVEARKNEFPNIQVLPIKFSSRELGAESWKFLLGAYGNEALYVRQMVQVMQKHREGLTLDILKQELAQANLSPGIQNLADLRIGFAQPYIDDAANLRDLLRPGRTVIVDLRDEWIETEQALGLFVVMMRIFAGAKYQNQAFNKLVIFDEAHKYINQKELVGQVVETIREMRHQATSVMIASQDPTSVPREVIELTSMLILHRMTSPQWLKHLKSAVSALADLPETTVAALKPGEALLWAQRSTDPRFMQRPQKIHVRPRFTLHGGGTKTALAGETVR